MDILDGHCHIGEGHDMSLSPEALIREMDASGVARAVVCPMDRYIAVYNREGNDFVFRAVREFPDRLIGFATVNPWYGDAAREEADRALDMGASGLKFNPSLQGFLLNDRIVHPLVERARDARVPVYFHTGTPVHSMPFQLVNLAELFPEVCFVMGHGATTDLWNDAVPAARRAPNIYVDTSLNAPASIRRITEAIGPERVFFSSNVPSCSLGVEVEKVHLAISEPEARRMIFRDTLLRLLGS